MTRVPSAKFLAEAKKHWWQPGQSGNPTGPRKLPEEIKRLKTDSLQRAIEILHGLVSDDTYTRTLSPDQLFRMMEIIYDRFGLPKVTRSEMSGPDGQPIETNSHSELSELGKQKLENLIDRLNELKKSNRL